MTQKLIEFPQKLTLIISYRKRRQAENEDAESTVTVEEATETPVESEDDLLTIRYDQVLAHTLFAVTYGHDSEKSAHRPSSDLYGLQKVGRAIHRRL